MILCIKLSIFYLLFKNIIIGLGLKLDVRVGLGLGLGLGLVLCPGLKLRICLEWDIDCKAVGVKHVLYNLQNSSCYLPSCITESLVVNFPQLLCFFHFFHPFKILDQND